MNQTKCNAPPTTTSWGLIPQVLFLCSSSITFHMYDKIILQCRWTSVPNLMSFACRCSWDIEITWRDRQADGPTDGRWWSTGVVKKGFDPVSLILFVTVTTAQPSCNTIRHAANSAHVLTHYGAHTSRSEGPLIPSRLHSCCTARSSPPAHVWPGGKKRTRLPG